MAVAEAFVPATPRRGTARWSGLPKAFRLTTVADKVGLVLLAVLVVAGVFAPLIAPYNPIVPSGLPFTLPLHGGHLMGTDEVGFDIFSRVLFGLRASLVGAAVVVASGVIIGGTIGLAAGVVGGWVDTALMRLTDLFLALPGPVLAIAFVAALGPSEVHTLIAVAIVWWPFYARIMRGEIRALAARPHLEAATLAGAGPFRRAFRHLLPGAVPAIVVTASLDVGNLVLTLAGLSFLGLGAPAPAPELGAMAARGLQFLLQEWWVPVMPAAVVFLLTMASNLSGDGLNNAMRDR
jgi:peptide/nickel transport system permease protein